ncbi:MAG: hypothetical protein WD690_09480 [Vicinamibacterales bacterium]
MALGERIGPKIALVLAGMILNLGMGTGTIAVPFQSPPTKPASRPEATLPWLGSVSLNRTTSIAAAADGDISGTVRLLRPAIRGGIAVVLSTCPVVAAGSGERGGLSATVIPPRLTIPGGLDSATFWIRSKGSLSGSTNSPCNVTAKYGDETQTATFTIESLKITALTLVPQAAVGPFTATGTVTLNGRPLEATTVALTGSDPQVVRFRTIVGPITREGPSAQESVNLTFTSSASNPQTFQVVASPVPQARTLTITARMGGQTVIRPITVRH